MSQPGPIIEVIKLANAGFAFNNHRLCVITLALLLNVSGQN